MGDTGRGTLEYCGVSGKIDIIMGTFGKARIRTQLSVALSEEDILYIVECF